MIVDPKQAVSSGGTHLQLARAKFQHFDKVTVVVKKKQDEYLATSRGERRAHQVSSLPRPHDISGTCIHILLPFASTTSSGKHETEQNNKQHIFRQQQHFQPYFCYSFHILVFQIMLLDQVLTILPYTATTVSFLPSYIPNS